MQSAARIAIVVLGLGTFLLNPSFGCISGEEEWDYDREDLQAAVVGTWKVTTPDGEALLVLAPAPAASATGAAKTFVKSAFACGDRSFYKSAAACISSSSLALTGQISGSQTPPGNNSVRGQFRVYGLKFTQGRVELMLPEGKQLFGEYQGRLVDEFEGSLWGEGGAALGRVMFARVK